MVDREQLLKEIAGALSKSEMMEDEVTASLLSSASDRLTHRTALNRLNYYEEKGYLVKRQGIGQKRENAYRPADGYTWDTLIPLITGG